MTCGDDWWFTDETDILCGLPDPFADPLFDWLEEVLLAEGLGGGIIRFGTGGTGYGWKTIIKFMIKEKLIDVRKETLKEF